MNQTIRYPLILTMICCAVAAGVGGVFVLARDRIEMREMERRQEALKEIFGEGAYTELHFESDDAAKNVYRVFDEQNDLAGYSTTGSAQGYGGRIRTLVGVTPELDRIKAVRVLFQSETPGLGARIEEVETKTTWFKLLTGQAEDDHDRSPWFLEQFSGYPIEGGRLREDGTGNLTADGAQIDAITGATISSEAVVEAINDALARINEAVKVE